MCPKGLEWWLTEPVFIWGTTVSFCAQTVIGCGTHCAGLQTANTHTKKKPLAWSARPYLFMLIAVQHVSAQTSNTSVDDESLFLLRTTTTISLGSYFNISHVQPCLFWFKREGRVLYTVAHFLVLAGFMHAWAQLLPRHPQTVPRNAWTVPETAFSSGTGHRARARTVVFRLIKWSGFWGEVRSGPCPGHSCENV